MILSKVFPTHLMGEIGLYLEHGLDSIDSGTNLLLKTHLLLEFQVHVYSLPDSASPFYRKRPTKSMLSYM